MARLAGRIQFTAIAGRAGPVVLIVGRLDTETRAIFVDELFQRQFVAASGAAAIATATSPTAATAATGASIAIATQCAAIDIVQCSISRIQSIDQQGTRDFVASVPTEHVTVEISAGETAQISESAQQNAGARTSVRVSGRKLRSTILTLR